MILATILFLTFSLAQAQFAGMPGETFSHGKIPIKANYTEFLGKNYQEGWVNEPFETTYFYGDKEFKVQYPQMVKRFKYTYKGEVLEDGVFLVRAERYEGQFFLMYQILFVWSLDLGSYSYFIAKQEDSKATYFYESNPDTGDTLQPTVPTSQGGPLIWRIDVAEFISDGI